ncbi:MAG TPA: hypothetical protein VD929_07290 [Caulobacteraceae bacterium]|nr:hypothetical protein [Caulobacteraceae bacterium]
MTSYQRLRGWLVAGTLAGVAGAAPHLGAGDLDLAAAWFLISVAVFQAIGFVRASLY